MKVIIKQFIPETSRGIQLNPQPASYHLRNVLPLTSSTVITAQLVKRRQRAKEISKVCGRHGPIVMDEFSRITTFNHSECIGGIRSGISTNGAYINVCGGVGTVVAAEEWEAFKLEDHAN